MTRSSHDHFYLNKTEGKFLGVCAGLADYLGVDVLWVRVGLVTLTLLGFGSTIPLYLVIAFFASRGPRSVDRRYEDDRDEERRLRRQLAQGRKTRLRSDLGEIDQRLSAMERHFGREGSLPSDIDRMR